MNETKAMATKNAVPIKGEKDEIDWTRIDTDIVFEGKAIKLPSEPGEMPLEHAIDHLQKMAEAEKQKYSTLEVVSGLPWDAAVALYRSIVEIYGVALPQSTFSWFFGEQPPTFITVKTGPAKKDVVQIPCGAIQLPGMKDPVTLNMINKPGHMVGAYLQGEVHKKDRARIVEIATRAREILRTQSVYKGKAIILKVTDKGLLDTSMQPEFFDVSGVTEDDAIYNKITKSLIQTSILAPIKHTEECRRHGIPLKRGVLLEGPYGTGKTLTARVSAATAMKNGWTFIVLERAQGLKAALEVAVQFEPCVVFAEDIDRFGDREKETVNDLVNLIDGLVPSSKAVMTVLTTNFVEKIDKALLRPGRLDAVITIDAPDADTVQKLVRFYGAKLLDPAVDVTEVGDVLAGQIPATIAEVVKRAKLAMLTEGRAVLTSDDLTVAAHGMKRHLDLLGAEPPERDARDELFEAIVAAAANAITNGNKELGVTERWVEGVAQYCEVGDYK